MKLLGISHSSHLTVTCLPKIVVPLVPFQARLVRSWAHGVLVWPWALPHHKHGCPGLGLLLWGEADWVVVVWPVKMNLVKLDGVNQAQQLWFSLSASEGRPGPLWDLEFLRVSVSLSTPGRAWWDKGFKWLLRCCTLLGDGGFTISHPDKSRARVWPRGSWKILMITPHLGFRPQNTNV